MSQLLCVLFWCKTFRYFTGVQSCSLLLVLYGISNYHYKQYGEMTYAICDFRIYYETLNCALKKAFIIKWVFFQDMFLATLLKSFNFALAFLHILLMCSSNFNSLSVLAPNSFSHLLLFACVCLCVFTSIHREGFISLGLEFQGTDQRRCVKDVSFLFQVPSSLL